MVNIVLLSKEKIRKDLKNMTGNIKDKLKKYDDTMMSIIEDLNTNDLQTKTVTLRIGGTLFELTPKAGEPLEIEAQIRKEYEEKLNEKRNLIKDSIKSKMSEVSILVSSIQDEYERKERLLKDTLAKSAPMPNVTWDHAVRGLSIVKGQGRGEICWLVKRTYNPKYVDHKNIEPLYIKKLMTNIYIRVRTQDDNIVGVSSHYMNNLEYFDHYHQNHPDCWGNWVYPKKWKVVEDIITVADQAIAVMENINTMSIARRTPRLLPRLETLRRHVSRETTAPVDIKVGTTGLREGLGMAEPNSDIWGN
jgi:hypothetical protein